MPEVDVADLNDRIRVLEERLSAVNLPAPITKSGPATSPAQAAENATGPRNEAPLVQLEQRIAASTPEDALKFSLIRERWIVQDEAAKDRHHARRMNLWRLASQVGLSVLAISSGVGLVFGGYSLPGFFALGVGLYCLAPKLVESVSKRVFGDGNE